MRVTCLILAAAALFAALAPAAARGQYEDREPNTLGLFTSTTPRVGLGGDDQYNGAPGAITLYAVLLNPWNTGADAAIDTVGGYAFRVEPSANVFLLELELPAGTACATGSDVVLTDAALPVAGNACVLATLLLGAFTQVESPVWGLPTSETSCLPGRLEVRDAVRGGAASAVVPLGGPDVPALFWFWPGCGCPPVATTRWGEVQALYR